MSMKNYKHETELVQTVTTCKGCKSLGLTRATFGSDLVSVVYVAKEGGFDLSIKSKTVTLWTFEDFKEYVKRLCYLFGQEAYHVMDFTLSGYAYDTQASMFVGTEPRSAPGSGMKGLAKDVTLRYR